MCKGVRKYESTKVRFQFGMYNAGWGEPFPAAASPLSFSSISHSAFRIPHFRWLVR